MILGSVGEWIIGNTFPFVVFGTFGAFWLSFAATLQPFFNAYGAYVTNPTVAATAMGEPGNAAGLSTPAFNASFAFFLLFMGLICLIFLICSLRTNIVFFVIFLSLVGAFGCLAGAYWNLALAYENAANVSAASKASKLVVVSTHLSNAQNGHTNELLGRWCFYICYLYGRMVDFLRHHARLSRLPLRHPRWRSLPYHQRRKPEESGQGTRGLITKKKSNTPSEKPLQVVGSFGYYCACIVGFVQAIDILDNIPCSWLASNAMNL